MILASLSAPRSLATLPLCWAEQPAQRSPEKGTSTAKSNVAARKFHEELGGFFFDCTHQGGLRPFFLFWS